MENTGLPRMLKFPLDSHKLADLNKNTILDHSIANFPYIIIIKEMEYI